MSFGKFKTRIIKEFETGIFVKFKTAVDTRNFFNNVPYKILYLSINVLN